MNDRHLPPHAADTTVVADPVLPAGTRLGPFELQRVLARSASAVVYLATDHGLALTVAIQEYLPLRLVERDPGLRLRAVETWHEDVIARGLRAFIDEARLLAHGDHPALLRVSQLFEANGSAYRVMPFYAGKRLTDLRREMPEAPDEASLRALLDGLLGALEAIHRGGRAHGGVTPGNIMLLGDDRPLLLGPGQAGREIGSDLVESLMASVEAPLAPEGAAPAPGVPARAGADLYALAAVTRFCITGVLPPPPGPGRAHESMAAVIARSFEPAARPRYSAELLGTLDAAMSPFAEDWPIGAAQFRSWLAGGAPPGRGRAETPLEPVLATWPEPASLRAAEHTASAASAARPASPPSVAPAVPITDASADPMTTDRAPWVMAARGAKRRARSYQLALAGALVVVAVGIAAAVYLGGIWNPVPALALGRLPDIAGERSVEPNPEPARPLAPSAPAESAPAPPAVAAAAAVVAAEPPAAPTSEAGAEELAQALPAPAPPVAETPPAAAPRRPVAPPVLHSSASAGGPRAACTAKTEFALYRCMQQQCDTRRWATHPQCVRLRSSDRVE